MKYTIEYAFIVDKNLNDDDGQKQLDHFIDYYDLEFVEIAMSDSQDIIYSGITRDLTLAEALLHNHEDVRFLAAMEAKKEKPFIQQVIEGRPVEDLMKFIGYEAEGFSNLREALGLTPGQFAVWSIASTNGKDHHAIFQQIAMEAKKEQP